MTSPTSSARPQQIGMQPVKVEGIPGAVDLGAEGVDRIENEEVDTTGATPRYDGAGELFVNGMGCTNFD